MKKLVVMMVCALLLCGCGAEETFETISDAWEISAAAPIPREIIVNLPGEAAMGAIQSEHGRYYIGPDYEVAIETMESGDVDATIRSVSGFSREDLTVMETERTGLKRYEFVWASAGENGDCLGRGIILDDGRYHYVMTVLRDAGSTSQFVWDEVFQSFEVV